MRKTEAILVRLDPALKQQLKQAAARLEIPVGQYVREAISCHLSVCRGTWEASVQRAKETA